MIEQELFDQNDQIGQYVIESAINNNSRNYIYKAFIPPNTEKKYFVIKALPYKTENDISKVEREKFILEQLADFDSILKHEDSIEHEVIIPKENEDGEIVDYNMKFICVVMNFCDEMDLRGYYFHHFIKSNLQKRAEIRREIFYQTLKILEILHQRKIVHNDIKPENFLVKSLDPLFIVLTDFEFASQIDGPIKHKCGSLYYMAPEIHNNVFHDFAADIWSLGIMFYFFSLYQFPFAISSRDRSLKAVKRKIETNDLIFSSSASPFLVNLIQNMLVADPNSRITAEDALKHQYFTNYLEVVDATKEKLNQPSFVQNQAKEAENIDETEKRY
ncbi:hypothetical protein M9Y10_004270 [Tritrichomonas musculus]|uniref:Protein kinase domain-containing protein n=1 Tax=Tritrichomonas musculus TaxID=1915356 RepID=A0ABR2JRT7_9EUKA